MKKRYIYSGLVGCIMLILSGMYAHAGSAGFLSLLPDVPLAPCYVEEEDSLVAFDKPDGRYVEVSTLCYGDKTGGMEALQFYYMSLPQLGWNVIESEKGAIRYWKNKEVLQLERESAINFSRIKIIVQPMSENIG